MRWFDTLRDPRQGETQHESAEPLADSPRKVKFANVSSPRVRPPSWLPSARRGAPTPPPPAVKREDGVSLKPPPLPSEFVDAIRAELEPERAARASEVPPREVRKPSMPPPAAAPVEVQAAPPAAPAEPILVVDPEATAAFEHAVELLASERSRVLQVTASQLGELATIIARRVIAHEISLNPQIVAGLVQEGLSALGAHDRVLVRVGRLFAASCASLEQRLADRGAQAEVRVDEHLPDYGCVVETELGRVDESIESRIATLLQALRPDSDLPAGGRG